MIWKEAVIIHQLIVPPENCDVAPRNFSTIWASLTECAISAVQCNICTTYAQLPVGWKGFSSNGQRDNVILSYHIINVFVKCHRQSYRGADGEGHRRQPSASLWTRSVARSTLQKDVVQYCLSLKLIGLPITGQILHTNALLMSARYLVTGMTHNSEA